MRFRVIKIRAGALCLAVAGAIALAAATGCKSKFVEADVINGTPSPISLVELDYPSASFGTEALAAGATYHYRFKILGSGPTKVLWTDAAHHDHTVAGPRLDEGQEGTLTVTISGDSAVWAKDLRP
jgi:hypothetical protein